MSSANKFNNTAISKSVAEKFLAALSTKEVDEVLASHAEFDAPKNWTPYGNAEKNWDRVGNQSSDPVGALTELLINSIDAILMRCAKREGY